MNITREEVKMIRTTVKMYKKEFDAWMDKTDTIERYRLTAADGHSVSNCTWEEVGNYCDWSKCFKYRIKPVLIDQWFNEYETTTKIYYNTQREAICAAMRAVTPIKRVAVHLED